MTWKANQMISWNRSSYTVPFLKAVVRKFTCMIEDMGLLPYRQRLQRLRIATLLELRIRGDLMETFRIINGFVSYGYNMFTKNTIYQT